MPIRTIRTSVTFTRPFLLAGYEKELPAGTYGLETDEELLEGASFIAYRRTLAFLELNSQPGSRVMAEVLTVDPGELDAALERDRAAEAASIPGTIGVSHRNGSGKAPGYTDGHPAIEPGENDDNAVYPGR